MSDIGWVTEWHRNYEPVWCGPGHSLPEQNEIIYQCDDNTHIRGFPVSSTGLLTF